MSSVLARRSILILLLLGGAGFMLTQGFADLSIAWNKTVLYAMQMQRELHRDLASAIRAVEQGQPQAYWSLISLAFLYGVFHAAGPGHGKVVISTYLATHESRLAPGLALSILSSLMQGVTAILVVSATTFLLEQSLKDSQTTGLTLEIVSYGLVALIGVFLAWRSARRLWRHSRASEAKGGHHHHEHHDGCCHAHGPKASDLENALSFRDMALMIASVGLRPCSGSILVLILAYATGLYAAGVAAVVAISVGTGLGVAILATLSVYARKAALAVSHLLSDSDQTLSRILDIAALIGGLLIIAFGIMLMQASLAVSNHPLL